VAQNTVTIIYNYFLTFKAHAGIILEATNKLPLIYSCSGCSNIAQVANQVAIDLNREQKAEMSCIAGIGGNVKSLVKLAKSGRTIIALDGCALHCVKSCLAQQGISANKHYTLTDHGIKKQYNFDFDASEVALIKQQVLHDLSAAD